MKRVPVCLFAFLLFGSCTAPKTSSNDSIPASTPEELKRDATKQSGLVLEFLREGDYESAWRAATEIEGAAIDLTVYLAQLAPPKTSQDRGSHREEIREASE